MSKSKEMDNGSAAERPAEEANDPLDIPDQVSEEIGFLREIVSLLQAAASDHEASLNIQLSHITADMTERLLRVKRLSRMLLEFCREHRKGRRPT